MAKHVSLRFTVEELQELRLVALNGYGDGDFYGLNDRAKYRQRDWRKRADAYGRAMEIIGAGLQELKGPQTDDQHAAQTPA